MDGILTTNLQAVPDSFEVYCTRLEVALRDLKMRLQAQYERRFPGQAVRIREALSQAEVAAWQTDFPHLFLPDLAAEAIERFSFSTKSRDKNECNGMAHIASGVRCASD